MTEASTRRNEQEQRQLILLSVDLVTYWFPGERSCNSVSGVERNSMLPA
jgi:hypothetical protein